MTIQEAKNNKPKYDDLIGKTVRYKDLDYLVQDVVIVPSDSSTWAEMTSEIKEEGGAATVDKLPKEKEVELALLGNDVSDGTSAVLKVTEVEFLL